MKMKNKKGFTLAEVLITLGIIGVVAALTVPTLMQNVTNKQFESGNKVFTNKLKEALKVMNTQQILRGYSTTEAFMNEFKKHYKINHICVDNPTQCFQKTVTWNDKEVDLSNIREAKDIVQYGPDEQDWGTNVVGVQFANGMSGLMAYNPKCKADPFNMQSEVLNCVAIVYDLNANATPNEYGKDLMTTANVKNLSGSAIDINGVKVAKIIPSDLIAPVNCTDASSPDYQYCPTEDPTQFETDYWAGAAKACGGRDKLPTTSQLEKIQASIDEEPNDFLAMTNIDSTGDEYIDIIGGNLTDFGYESLVYYGLTLHRMSSDRTSIWINHRDNSESRSSWFSEKTFAFCVEN